MSEASFQANPTTTTDGTSSQEVQAQLASFWQKQMEEIKVMKSDDFKQQELPLARIKKIMKMDEDVKMISAEAPVLFSKAAEIFISELSLRAWIHTEDNKRRTLQRNDIAMAITKFDQFDFLIDIVPRDELKPPKRQDDQVRQTAMMPDQVQYYFQLAQHHAGQMQQQQQATTQASAPQQQQQQPAAAATTTTTQAVQTVQGPIITGQPGQIITLGQGGQIQFIQAQPGQQIQGVQQIQVTQAQTTPITVSTTVGSGTDTQQTTQLVQTQAGQVQLQTGQQGIQQIVTNTGEVQQLPFNQAQIQYIQQQQRGQQGQVQTVQLAQPAQQQTGQQGEFISQIAPGQAIYQIQQGVQPQILIQQQQQVAGTTEQDAQQQQTVTEQQTQ
ncbi:nuclear transcription factor Y subunit gamma-like isoform X1 [Ptychodera flava]|uniref:nuclear transcription factor Y subunit gamma-like isoform X1 n=1 Tax=Ptychodera flava TaxID=63121 RepID=UPI003969F41C